MKTKYPKLIKLTVALALVAGLFSLMAAPALGCSWLTIEIYPPSGPVGTEITIVYWGADTHAGEHGRRAVGENSVRFGDLTLDNPPQFDIEGIFTITVPDVPAGDYLIYVPEWTIASHGEAIFTVTEGPVTHNPSTMVGHTLGRLDGRYERVWGYDSATQTWQVYDSSKPAQRINDLEMLDRWQTLWIKVTEDDVVLNWRGTLYFLGKGWNLISALGDTYGIGDVITVSSPGDGL